jgi:hypothetical protein
MMNNVNVERTDIFRVASEESAISGLNKSSS